MLLTILIEVKTYEERFQRLVSGDRSRYIVWNRGNLWNRRRKILTGSWGNDGKNEFWSKIESAWKISLNIPLVCGRS